MSFLEKNDFKGTCNYKKNGGVFQPLTPNISIYFLFLIHRQYYQINFIINNFNIFHFH